MEKITLQAPVENNQEAGLMEDDRDIRLLQDLEMVLVGGGSDPIVTW
jgi:hypothetical protein